MTPTETPSLTRRVLLRIAAEVSGLSPRTLRKFIKAGKLRAYRPGLKNWYVDLNDLEALFASCCVNAPSAPAAAVAG
jgi:excisionase family DNA binding protein